MSIKKVTQSNVDKILNSDIYDLTKFVDDIKKVNIDGVDNSKDTLIVGMYGYLGYEFASLLQNSIVVASELSNEAIPTRAKFDRNVITHALSLGVKKVAATAANMKVMLIFPEKALRNNMVDNKFVLKSTTPIYFDEHEFHTDYDIEINYFQFDSSTNGSIPDYVYTANYNMDVPNPISDIDNSYLPPVSIYADKSDNMVMLITTLHQVEYTEIEEKIVGSDDFVNKTINFSFENQMSHFTVEVYEDGRDEPIELTPVYDGLYNQVTTNYCYYQYINSNTIRIRFDPTNSYQPRTNCNVIIKLYTTHGYEGNFDYTSDLMVRLTSDEYTNLYMIVKQRSDEGSTGGLDRKSVEELQRIIPKESLSRGSITTLSDLRNYFNSINNETSVLHVFRKEDNILTRIYYTYCLMKDKDNNVVPTNTIPIYMDQSDMDIARNQMFLESGSKIYYYKNQYVVNTPFMKNNYLGYLDDVSSSGILYKYNDPDHNFNNILFKEPTSSVAHDGDHIYVKMHSTRQWFSGLVMNTGTLLDENGNFIAAYVEAEHDDGSYHQYPKHFFLPNPFNSSTHDMTYLESLSDDPFANMVSELIRNPGDDIAEEIVIKRSYERNPTDPLFSFANLTTVGENSLQPGDHIRFTIRSTDPVIVAESILGEILSISTKLGQVIGLNIATLDQETGQVVSSFYRVPSITDEPDPTLVDIETITPTTNFIYTNPLSIVLRDDDTIDSHRITASYYLDIINENRYLDFKCINSKSPLQFIASYIKVVRKSYLSEDRYKYTISVDLVPNIGQVTEEMQIRTQVVGVYYKDGEPICYSIGEFISGDDGCMTYHFYLYTRPFSKTETDTEPVVLDDDGCLFIGDYTGTLDPFIYEIDVTSPERTELQSVYLDQNTEFRIYTLYNYKDRTVSECTDNLAGAYYGLSSIISIEDTPLTSILRGDTSFPGRPDLINPTQDIPAYTLNDMDLTNVYHCKEGINLLYDYSNLMNSYVTLLRTENIFSPSTLGTIIGTITNRVPVIRYFYLSDEDKLNTFIKEIKRKILYVLDAIDPLETTFGLDFKFFNSYGPSNMYHVTDRDGNTGELIDNVSLSMNFRTKFYNEDNDKETIIPQIKNEIKAYMENIEDLDDLHIPNLTTEIENKFSEYIIYFEYVSFNIYDANYQHIVTDENMEMLTVVPEFLNINVDDISGLPFINISIVT